MNQDAIRGQPFENSVGFAGKRGIDLMLAGSNWLDET